jgi:ERCC4-type nuclease
MKVILDERERDLFEKCTDIINSNSTYAKLSKEVLPLGDVYIKTDEDKDVLLIERKTIADLLSSIKDGRYEEQSYRLIHSSGFPHHSIIYIIEGSITQLRTPMERKIVYSAITSLNFFKGFSVIRTSNVAETAEYVVWMADKIERSFLKSVFPYYLQPQNAPTRQDGEETTLDGGEQSLENVMQTAPANYCTVVKKVKKDNITPDNIGEIILCQIPGVSSVTAIAVMKRYITFPKLMEELNSNPLCLQDVVCETKGKMRKISKACVENIRLFLTNKPLVV